MILLDMFWVKLPEELHGGDPSAMLKRQTVLNLFVALGAAAAAYMLLIWVSACAIGT